MTIRDTAKDKLYGFYLTSSNLEILTLLRRSIDNEYCSLLMQGSEVDRIKFECHSTNLVLAILQIINPCLQSFKLGLTIEAVESNSIRQIRSPVCWSKL